MAYQRFSDKWLSSVKPPQHGRDDYADVLCPCLHVRVSARGSKTFSVMLRSNGRLHRLTLGRYPAITLATARSLTGGILADAAARGITSAIDARRLTYDEAVEAYTDRHLKPNARSWKDIRATLLHPTLQHLRDRRVCTISKREIIDALDRIVARGTPQAAVNLHRRVKMLFNWLVDRDLLDASPCDRIRPPARVVERDRVLDDRELVAVWHATFTLPVPWSHMFRLLLLTGQRRSEVAGMTWSEVDRDTWTIARSRVKKDRAHVVPLTPSCLEDLQSLPNHGPDTYVFSTTNGVRPSSNFAKMKRRLDEAAGVHGWRIHDLRRTVRSKFAELGVSRDVARKVLNHEDGKVDRIYNRYDYLAEKRKALARWETHLNSLIQKDQLTRG